MRILVASRFAFLIAVAALLLTIAAFVPGARAGEPVPPGDANCDGAVNSIDAALIFQREAALKDSLPCPDAADVDGDGDANSIDARLILEIGAVGNDLVRMYLTVIEPAGLCGTQVKAVSCDIPAGTGFRLGIVLPSAPPEGYAAIQTHAYLDGLYYSGARPPEEEIVWSESLLPLRSVHASHFVGHGSLSNLIPPFPRSQYTGILVEMEVACRAAPETNRVSLLVYDPFVNSLGSSISFPEPEGEVTTLAPVTVAHRDDLDLGLGPLPVAHTLEINCV